MHTNYIALLRGINVGGNAKISMPLLKQTFQRLGFEHVSTYINSGNVVFRSALGDHQQVASMITEAIHADFTLDVPVLVRSEEQLTLVVEALPETWQNNADQKTDILFLWDEVDTPESVIELEAVEGVDELRYVPGAIIWHIERKDYAQSTMQQFIRTKVYKKMTARNCNTVRKLAAILNAMDGKHTK